MTVALNLLKSFFFDCNSGKLVHEIILLHSSIHVIYKFTVGDSAE